MKPVKKHLPSSVKSVIKTKQSVKIISKNSQIAEENSLHKTDQMSSVLCISPHDVHPEELPKLLKKGICFKPQEDLLGRLLKLEKENQRLKSLSITDELTGLYNKRFFNKQLKIEIARTKRTGEPFCLMFIDLDNFKSVNDTLGHAKGDELLINICHLISQKTRPTDFACRYGGDEFTAILPATSILDGISIAQRWHELIKGITIKMKLNVSSSIGIDEYNPNCAITADEFLEKVDQELYKAKNSGKDKVSYPDLARTGIGQAKVVTKLLLQQI